jgi:NAD(P)-dependent dehydrogenase (short-subunit alcohol dehydrogenase family)
MHGHWPEFAGQVVVITGGTVGFGRDLAFLVARNGGTAWVCARSKDPVEQIAREAAAANLDIHASRTDVTDERAVERLIHGAFDHGGRLDGLVCAAGSGHMGTIEEIHPEAWDETVTDKLRGVYFPVRHAMPIMKAAGRGSIVVVSSVHAHANSERRDAIAPATAAMVAFMRGVAVSMSPFGVRANSVSPGPVETPTWRRNWERAFPDMAFDEIKQRVGRSIPMRRIGQPVDVAEPIAFLLSDRSRYNSGTDLKIDGGLTAKLAMATQLFD